MSFSLKPNTEGRSEIVLVDEPSYIVPFPIAPLSLEGTLTNGRWLIVSFSVWSIHDLEAAHRAIVVAKQHGGEFQLGLRPFDDPIENTTWLPIASEAKRELVDIEVTESNQRRFVAIKGRTDANPVWATILDGRFITITFGQLSEADFDNLIQQLLTTRV